MARNSKRAWKLQEYPSHVGPVNCLSIGHKSGKVMATGGEDRKVNLWAVGKTSCILSLKGHTTPVESLRFNGTEDLVAAGSQGGVLKIWNLEASKILRTLSGHKCNIKSLDFHPFGEIIASGSMDTNVKLWDFRRKGCIFTYKGHTSTVNSLRFSPDGKWIVSASDDNTARLWDMSTGRQIAEFPHSSPVTTVEFHPIDFLLVTGGTDKTVKFWDLETFKMVDTTDGDSGPIRTVFVHPDGNCVYATCQDYLKVYGWEPVTCFDTVNVGWGKPADIVVHQNELIGASFQQSNVSIYIADLQKIQPICQDAYDQEQRPSNTSPFHRNASRRRSFLTKCPDSEVGNRSTPNDVSIKTPVRNINNDKDNNSDDGDTNDDDDDDGDDGENEAKSLDVSDLNVSSINYDRVFNPKKELPRDIPETASSHFQDNKTSSNMRVMTGHLPVNQQPPNKILFSQKTSESEPFKQTNVLSQAHNVFKQTPQYVQKQLTQNTAVDNGNNNTSMMTSTPATTTSTSATKPLRRAVTGMIHSKGRDSPRNRVATNFRTITTSSTTTPNITATNTTTTPTVATTTTKSDDNNIDNPATRYFRLNSTSEDNKKLTLKQEEDYKLLDFSTNFSPQGNVDDSFPTKPPPSNYFQSNLSSTSTVPRNYKMNTTNKQDHPGNCSIIEDFIPKQFSEDMGDEKAMSIIGGGHQVVVSVLSNRNRNLQVFKTLRSGGNIRMALDSVASMNDEAVFQDVINLLLQNPAEWTLDTCLCVLPVINNLIGGRYELYTNTGLKATNFILRTFATLIKDTISNVSSIGIDISREERYNKSLKCQHHLTNIGMELDKRSASFRTSTQNDQIREIKLLLAQLE